MQFRALSFGAVLGFAILAVSSCQCGGPPTGRCGPNNCEGCCTVMGECVPLANTTDMACGNQGIVCSNCATMGQTCNKTTNSCIGNIAGGGSAAGGSAAGGTAGSMGGGMGGGAAAGGSAGGMSGTACNILTNPACPPGTQCLVADINGMTGDGTCVPGDCSVLAQDCANPMTKCTVQALADGGVGRLCTPFALGDGGLGDNVTCTPGVPDPCQRGAQCLGFQGTAAVCRRYCGPFNACGMNAACENAVGFTTPAGPSNERHLICAAVIACNPFDQTPCGPAEACQSGMMGPRCVMAGSNAAGQPCSPMSTCARGATCVLPGPNTQMGTCRNICNVDGGMPTCAAGMCAGLQGAAFGACTM